METLSELMAAFAEENAEGTSLEGGSDAPIALTLAAADIVTKNPYEEKGVDPTNEDVPVYVSATTEIDKAGTVGYDYALGKEYNIVPVYYGADGSESAEAPAELANYRVKSGSEEDGTAERAL